jgi:hypothetical protein
VSPETILSLAASPVLAAAMAKAWTWWTQRDAAKLAEAAAEAKARHEREAAARVSSAGERADIVALLQQQLTAGEARAELAVARSAALATALSENAAAMRENSASLDALRSALADHAAEEFATLREVHAVVRQIVGDGSEVSRTSIVPGLRGPTPPRGIVPLPAVTAPPRKGGE